MNNAFLFKGYFLHNYLTVIGAPNEWMIENHTKNLFKWLEFDFEKKLITEVSNILLKFQIFVKPDCKHNKDKLEAVQTCAKFNTEVNKWSSSYQDIDS